MIVFCWGIRMSLKSRPDGLDQKLIRMRQQNNHFAHEIQTLYFLNLFKPLLIKFILITKRSDIQVARLRWSLGYEFL
jgi:hypothetical protein